MPVSHPQGGRRLPLFWAVLALTLLVAAALPAVACAAGPATIAMGTVTAASSGDPISGAHVYVSFYDEPMAEWYFAAEATTTAQGAYAVSDTYGYGPGEYSIVVSADGYQSVTEQRTWNGTDPLSVDVALTVAQAVSSGTVSDAVTSQGVASAQVTAEFHDPGTGMWETTGFVRTASDGTYVVYDTAALGAGEYRITASAKGYLPKSVTSTWNGVTPLAVDIALERPPVIASGTVTDAVSGDPIDGAYVRSEFYDAGSESWLISDDYWTGADGAYVLSDFYGRGPGLYRVYATAAGHVFKMSSGTWNGTDPLAFDFSLDTGAALAAGSVTETSTGDPIDAASVEADFYDPESGQWWFAGNTASGTDGSYTLEDSYRFGAGEYRFVAWADGYASVETTVAWDGVDSMIVDFVLERTTLDAYEPDDTVALATLVAIDGVAQQHTLYPAGDHDWASFEAASGETYVIETDLAGATETDTYLYLYAADGTTVLDENDDSAVGLSRIEWTSSADQTVYVMVRHTDDGVGTGAYALGVSTLPDPVNQAPVAVADSYSVNEDQVLHVAAPGVLANDTDPDDDVLSAVLVQNVAHGTLVLNADGSFTYTPSADWNGQDGFTYRAEDGGLASNTVAVTITVAPVYDPPPTLTITPIAGSSRIDTAIKASVQAFSPGGADNVVIATAYNWPDALGGAALAGALDGPILLTEPDQLPSAVLNEIVRLGAKKVVILGGSGAVSSAVETTLKTKLGASNVERIAGSDRYTTSRMIAARCVDALGSAYDGTAFLATGVNFPDALGASPLAAAKGWPIYLVNPATGADRALVSAMKSDGVKHALALGGTGAIAADVVTDVRAKVPSTVARLSGSNRYGTACAVATYGVNTAGLTWNHLAIATGENFPDALAGGVLQGRTGSVMLLTPVKSLDAGVADILEAHGATIAEVRFLGGTAAVSQPVRDAVAAKLR